MAVAQLYFHLAPKAEVGVIAKALVRLMRSHRSVRRMEDHWGWMCFDEVTRQCQNNVKMSGNVIVHPYLLYLLLSLLPPPPGVIIKCFCHSVIIYMHLVSIKISILLSALHMKIVDEKSVSSTIRFIMLWQDHWINCDNTITAWSGGGWISWFSFVFTFSTAKSSM